MYTNQERKIQFAKTSIKIIFQWTKEKHIQRRNTNEDNQNRESEIITNAKPTEKPTPSQERR